MNQSNLIVYIQKLILWVLRDLRGFHSKGLEKSIDFFYGFIY